MAENPVGIRGIEFLEFSSPSPERMDQLFKAFGFSKLAKRKDGNNVLYKQNDIRFLLNNQPASFSKEFEKMHGPCVSAMGWRVDDAHAALKAAVARGAKEAPKGDYVLRDGTKVPAIKGVGDCNIYFLEPKYRKNDLWPLGFEPLTHPEIVDNKGFERIDHLTNNVEKGTMAHWSEFYKKVFGFEEIRYFDIRGIKTGLTSFALKSPDGSFCIPINEGTEDKSQINEYLREYKGPGVQHIAFLTSDILSSLKAMEGGPIQTLTIDDEYYRDIFKRLPKITESHSEIQKRNVLADGDDDGYILQIFTKNIIGPIFIELIQRKNHHSFGEGNFGALFRAIERDQEERGVL